MTTDFTLSSDAASATAFAADFASTETDWRRVAEAGLKGHPLDQVLVHRTLDGVVVDAIAARAQPRPIAGRPPGARWIAATRIDLADPAEANAQALEDLNNGASGLVIVFAPPGDGDGVFADTLDRLDRALDGVLLDLAPVHLDLAAFEGRMAAALVAALVERRSLAAAEAQITFGIDVLRDLARTGTLPKPWPEMGLRTASVVDGLKRRGFSGPILSIDGRTAHGAGAGAAQELAGVLASATEHVRLLVASGVALETAADAVSFLLACDADQFGVIAKLRAARLLWAAWRRASGLPPRVVHIHAETSRRMMTRRDPETNMVRTTIAAFAAGVGGADSVTVLPFTDALGASDRDGRRIARNAQAIILEESNAHRVCDPAAGAGAIEQLTDRLAEAAWSLFREIEQDGGFYQALVGGAWQARLAATRAARAAAVAARRTPIVGVTEYPQPGAAAPWPKRSAAIERAPCVKPLATILGEDAAAFDAMVQAFHDGSSFADVRGASRPAPSVSATPLDLDRLASPFEHLRSRNERATPQPNAYLALLGPVARHSARAGFMRNLLAAGGIAAIDGPIVAEPAQIAEAFLQSELQLAIVCGSDDAYAQDGAAVVAAIVVRGATAWIAGRPKDGCDALVAAGVTRFVAAGEDALDMLEQASEIIAGAGERGAGGAL